MARGSGLFLPLRLVKLLLFGINLTFLILGLLLIIFGGVSYTFDIVNSLLQVPKFALGLILLGVAIIVISLLGACASYHQLRWLLIVYIVLLTIVIITQIAIAITAGAFQSKVDGLLEKGWGGLSDDKDTKSQIERYFNCCGFYNYTDAPSWNCPSSYKGCFYAIDNFVKEKIDIVAVSAAIIGAFEIIGLSLSIALFITMRRPSEDLDIYDPPSVALLPETRRGRF
eukprot:TRINITY_DN10746_c0_g1_i1.p1 TRINITY_DN10746_c0_g1~~TRINITY_DN10746_c0_g1_i1.p1  ORF type:complete len:227 (-),score=17.03 TRINITY_DN10746_c0_g1_i1:72-752(-)